MQDNPKNINRKYNPEEIIGVISKVLFNRKELKYQAMDSDL